MILIAHRGIKSLYPENTLIAFKAAHKMNIPWIEIDVTLSKDNTPIVVHDHILKQCNKEAKNKNVWNMSLKEIKQVDVGEWFSSQFKHERIPTLIEVIDLINTTGLKLNLEIKAQKENKTKWELLAKTVYNTIQKNNVKKNNIIISSFCVSILQYLHKYDKNLRIGLLADKKENKNWDVLMKKLPYHSIHLEQSLIKTTTITNIHKHNCKLYAWTVNNTKKAKTLTKWGIDGIISDCPQDLSCMD